ncbi:MAG: hypothetical protein OXH57_06375 [Ekhidna sp.]|nr:hypothetical protein [Ekhidna sp.]
MKKTEKKFIEKIRKIRDKMNEEIINLNADEIVDFYEKRLSEIQKKGERQLKRYNLLYFDLIASSY